VKLLASPVLPDTRNTTALFEGVKASPVCASDNSSIKVKMSMEHHWWIDNGQGKAEVLGEKSVSVPLHTPQI